MHGITLNGVNCIDALQCSLAILIRTQNSLTAIGILHTYFPFHLLSLISNVFCHSELHQSFTNYPRGHIATLHSVHSMNCITVVISRIYCCWDWTNSSILKLELPSTLVRPLLFFPERRQGYSYAVLDLSSTWKHSLSYSGLSALDGMRWLGLSSRALQLKGLGLDATPILSVLSDQQGWSCELIFKSEMRAWCLTALSSAQGQREELPLTT